MVIKEFRGEYRFLSNFYPCDIVMDGVVYQSLEHAYQASKTLSIPERSTIWRSSSPGQAKRLGRTVTMRKDWDEKKVDIMLSLLREKFATGWLRKKLLETYPAPLVEGNYWHDNFWGSCTCDKCKVIKKQNMLGILLTKVRGEMK